MGIDPLYRPEGINTTTQMHYLASAEAVLMHDQEKLSAALYRAEESYNKCDGSEHPLSQKVRDGCSEFSSSTAPG